MSTVGGSDDVGRVEWYGCRWAAEVWVWALLAESRSGAAFGGGTVADDDDDDDDARWRCWSTCCTGAVLGGDGSFFSASLGDETRGGGEGGEVYPCMRSKALTAGTSSSGGGGGRGRSGRMDRCLRGT